MHLKRHYKTVTKQEKDVTLHHELKKCNEEFAKPRFFAYICTMNNNKEWAQNVIIADVDYIDKVAFNLTVNFERMIGRRIPPADLAHWLDCIALDGGVREGDNEIQVVLVHDKTTAQLENFNPSNLAEELSGKAFKDNLGEFTIHVLPVEEIVSKTQFINDIVGAVCINSDVRRVMIIPNGEDGVTYPQIAGALRHVEDDSKRITMFAMQPMPGGNFRQEILGYSMLSALGIKADEIKE